MPKTLKKTFWDDEILEEDISEFINDEKWNKVRDTIEYKNNTQNSLIHHIRITKDSLKLRQRLLDQFKFNIFPAAFRVYFIDHSAGTFRWFIYCDDGEVLGSCSPLKQLVKARQIDIGRPHPSCDWELFIEHNKLN